MDPSRRTLLLGLSAGIPAACSPLQVFDALTPRDPGGHLLSGDMPYGTHPRQHLSVYVPDAIPAKAAPVVVFFYGGSWKGGRREEYDFVGRAFAAAGFVTVLPDYRIYPEVRFPDFLDDGARAVRWTATRIAAFGGDPSRIVLAGHSAGAYNAAMLALDRRWLGRAGAGSGRVRALVGLSGPYDFLPLDEGTAQEVFGEAPDLEATQPVTFARPGAPPAFLATGDADDTVRPRNTASLAAKLRDAGVPVEERVYPGLNHADTLLALSVAFRSKAPVLDDMLAFLRARV